MAEISKPTDINKIWAASGTITVPSDGKISTGNIVEKPAYDYFNYWMNKADTFNAHVNQHGIVMWDSATEYQAEKSYIMGSDGVIYRCILTHTNKNPVTAPDKDTYWKVAFADYGSSYTKAESDAKYLIRNNNLSEVSNVNTARTNLFVYSISQVDSLVAQATETVRGTAEVSTSAEAQALSSDTVMITPNKLDMAFKGSNQSLSSSGYQKLPGGLIIQWGYVSSNYLGVTTFPIAFPSAVVSVNVTQKNAISVVSPYGVFGITNSKFEYRNDRADIIGYFIAIGY